MSETQARDRLALASPEEERKARWKAFKRFPNMSYHDYICYEWLTRTRRMKPQADFIYRGRFTGDFYFPGRRISWLLRGDSLRETPSVAFTVAQLRGKGVTVVEIRGRDIEQRTDYVLRQALAGRQLH